MEVILRLEFPETALYEALRDAAKMFYRSKGIAYEPDPHPRASDMQKRREYLTTASHEQLQPHYEKLLAQQREAHLATEALQQQKKAEAAAAKERKRFYNSPDALADFGYWAELEYWTFEEALALLMARNPRVVTLKAIRSEVDSTRMFLGPEMSKFLTEYEDLRTIAERATLMQGPRLRPAQVLLWATSLIRFQPPPDLVTAVATVLRTRAGTPAGSTAAAPITATSASGSGSVPVTVSLPVTVAAPAPGVVSVPPSVPVPVRAGDTGASVTHTTKAKRRDALAPAIEEAQRRCSDPFDPAAVWAVLLIMAERQEPPLRGCTEDGIQYLRDGTAATLSRDALNKRVQRAKARS